MKLRLLILKRITDDVSKQSIMSNDTICVKMSTAKSKRQWLSGVNLKKFKTSLYGSWGQWHNHGVFWISRHPPWTVLIKMSLDDNLKTF